jgi:hypothetical protein
MKGKGTGKKNRRHEVAKAHRHKEKKGQRHKGIWENDFSGSIRISQRSYLGEIAILYS